ncbi:MAG: carbohydrate ABC transporter substrate-binding protein [Verrucomicrobia bacterium]|nr:carbohydrate ABC transporter substrate-binding protein [Verrucomicrobiota bacterium]MCH8527533.1 ABC transporter substrate-binding protein [Kiritimatiellia bacterium]
MMGIWTGLKQKFPLLVVGGAFLWSAVAIVSYRAEETPPGATVVLRLGHWQLEGGVRQGLDAVIQEYQKRNPHVHIVQDAIPESTYGMWLTTQVMGGTAPDMVQMGMLPYHVLLGYYNRYFIPLTEHVQNPNPHNQGTKHENTPWRETFKDGMRTSYIEELQEYMLVPVSQFGIRLFYNRDLLRELTGLEEAPLDYHAFLEACEMIRNQTDEHGNAYIPIAGSGYHFTMWDHFMLAPMTYGAVRVADFNRDGAVGNNELFLAFKLGMLDFDFPPFRARFRMMREITDNIQAGFTGLGRDESVFLFAQQRAVFIPTGTWDVGSLVVQAEGQFEVGVSNFPRPTRDDPVYGHIVEGPTYERAEGGFPFAISRNSRHPEVALDFLQFITSLEGNQKLNNIIGWIPSVLGAEMPPELEAFEPNLEGVFNAMPITLGGETLVRWNQLYDLYKIGQISYEELGETFTDYYLRHGGREIAENLRNFRRGEEGEERMLSVIRSRALLEEDENLRASSWFRYRNAAYSRLISRYFGNLAFMALMEEGRDPEAPLPYELSPFAMDQVRERLRRELETERQTENTHDQ